jgi:signal transduction histidine kinase
MPPVALPSSRTPRAIWLRWLFSGCIALMACTAWPLQAQVLTFTQALSAAADSDHFPAGATQVVSLPDDWSSSRPGVAGPVWYRVAFEAPGVRLQNELLGLFIERVCSNFEVHLNGQLVHRDGHAVDDMSRNCHHPQLVTLPNALLRPGANVLDLKVTGRPLERVASRHRAAGLSPFVLGPYTLLADVHARATAWKVTLPEVVSATLLLLGGFMFVMGWRHRNDSYLAYFGALSMGWALVTARLWVGDMHFYQPMPEITLCALAPGVALFAVQFLLRHAGRRDRRVTIALLVQCLVVPLSLVLAGDDHLFVAAHTWYAVLSAEVLAAVAYHLVVTRRERPDEFWPMATLLGFSTVLMGAELLGQQRGVNSLLSDVSHLAIPVIFVAIGLRLVRDYGGALKESEAGRMTLEARIEEATAEIERNFAQLAELRVEQVTERERKRIAADLHDDLGAKLLTIVHTSESERISTLAREALEEMRLSVRGLTGKPVRLIDALGDWRAEVVSRLAQAGVEAEWDSPTDDVPQTLSARAYVQTTRILREAVSNIIKHSGASHCEVRCGIDGGDFQLVVQDNGRGIPLELDGRLDRGHGMSSMKHRAKQLQGQCLVESGPGYGTVIRLTLPV